MLYWKQAEKLKNDIQYLFCVNNGGGYETYNFVHRPGQFASCLFVPAFNDSSLCNVLPLLVFCFSLCQLLVVEYLSIMSSVCRCFTRVSFVPVF